MKKIESLQKRVVRWILCYPNKSYREMLIKLNLLPLNLYMQLLELLLLSRICLGEYNTDLTSAFLLTERRGKQYFTLPAIANEKQRQSFLYRTPNLANKIIPYTDIFSTNAKPEILKLFWSYFKVNFNEQVPCTWRICDCGNCKLTRPNFS